MPNIGGQSQAYPGSVRTCTSNDQLLRAVLKPDANHSGQFSPASIDPQANLPSGYIDPEAQDLEKFRGFLGDHFLVDLCQRQISSNPSLHGLFWVLKQEGGSQSPAAQPENDNTQYTREAEIASYLQFIRALPPEIRPCFSMEGSDHLYQLYDTLAEQTKQDESAGMDPHVLEESRLMANRLIFEYGLFDISDVQQSALERFTAFAMQNGLTKEEIEMLFGEVSSMYGDVEQILYGFTIIGSLRIAYMLNWANRLNGEILPDFSDFTRSIEESILDGSIGIKVLTADAATSSASKAYYDSYSNVIVLPPSIYNASSQMSMFATIIHECYHAYQDKLRRNRSLFDIEAEATAAGYKAAILLGGMSLIEQDIENEGILSEWQSYAETEKNRCVGMSYEQAMHRVDMGEEISFWHMAVLHSLDLQLRGSDSDYFRDIFYQMFRISNFKIAANKRSVHWLKDSINAYASGGLIGVSVDLPTILGYFSQLRKKMYSTPEKSNERYEAARTYLDFTMAMTARAAFINRDAVSKIQDEFGADEDAVADALIYRQVEWDGL